MGREKGKDKETERERERERERDWCEEGPRDPEAYFRRERKTRRWLGLATVVHVCVIVWMHTRAIEDIFYWFTCTGIHASVRSVNACTCEFGALVFLHPPIRAPVHNGGVWKHHNMDEISVFLDTLYLTHILNG